MSMYKHRMADSLSSPALAILGPLGDVHRPTLEHRVRCCSHEQCNGVAAQRGAPLQYSVFQRQAAVTCCCSYTRSISYLPTRMHAAVFSDEVNSTAHSVSFPSTFLSQPLPPSPLPRQPSPLPPPCLLAV